MTTHRKPEPLPDDSAPESVAGKKPAHVVSYYVGKDTYIQASIWERTIENGDNSFVVFDVSCRKRMKINDEWRPIYSFRGSELPFVLRAIQRAEDWILETRKQDVPF